VWVSSNKGWYTHALFIIYERYLICITYDIKIITNMKMALRTRKMAGITIKGGSDLVF